MSKPDLEVQIETMIPLTPLDFAKASVRDGFVAPEDLKDEALRLATLFVRGKNFANRGQAARIAELEAELADARRSVPVILVTAPVRAR